MTQMADAAVRRHPTALDLQQFIDRETGLATCERVPEIALHLALRPRLIFQAADDLFAGALGARPYWAFAWPGGQGIARLLLDQPERVAGRRVLDVGAGSALGAIAALKAGARSAIAADIDSLAAAAARRNAAVNQVDLVVTTQDLLGESPAADVLLIGDLVYEPELLTRVAGFIDAAVARGVRVYYGDRTTARRPARRDFRLIWELDAELTPPLVDGFIDRARVWEL
jgi:predicted nicotinamide N-methyase